MTVRVGPTVARERHDTLPDALGALERRLESLGVDARRERRRALAREYEPVAQVAARAELAGPSRLGVLRGPTLGGVDLRGDGSAEAYRGRVRRELVSQQPGETAYDALRRALVS